MSSQQLTHRNRDQMTAIHRQRFQSHFLEWKSSYFDPNFKEMCSQWHIDNMCPLVQVMPWCRTGDKPLSEPTKAEFLRIFASLGLLVLIMSLVDETQIVIEIVFIMVFHIYIYILYPWSKWWQHSIFCLRWLCWNISKPTNDFIYLLAIWNGVLTKFINHKSNPLKYVLRNRDVDRYLHIYLQRNPEMLPPFWPTIHLIDTLINANLWITCI